jgi:hypothetical protein
MREDNTMVKTTVTLSFDRAEEKFAYEFDFEDDMETLLEKFEQFMSFMGFELNGQRLTLQKFERQTHRLKERDGVIQFPTANSDADDGIDC